MTMIERVARALNLDPSHPVHRDVARAAIRAMRDPTDAMEKAGIEKDDELEWLQQDRAIPQVFTAMIDAALSEPQS